jgi:hypothetical protein
LIIGLRVSSILIVSVVELPDTEIPFAPIIFKISVGVVGTRSVPLTLSVSYKFGV